ncbi:MAG: TIGR04283 family arsenosugar biosynthesis glycosyltransferase, partial [Bacteroidota bacterium]
MTISIIIPTWNEAANIRQLLEYLQRLKAPSLLEEVLVIDGDSEDDTVSIAREMDAKVYVAPQKGRANQMNFGAHLAKGQILYFVHADVRPPLSCLLDIQQSIKDQKCIGCFAYHFKSDSRMLKMNAFFTQFDWMANGGGDQTLFVLKERFVELGGFDEQLPIMEDFDFVWRAKKRKYTMHLVKKRALVSARKYEQNSYLKVQLVNALTFMAFRWGFSPEKLADW